MVQIPAARLICNSKNRVNYSGNCKTGEGNLSNDKSSRNSCPPFRTKRFRFRNFISLALFTDRSELFSRRFNFNSSQTAQNYAESCLLTSFFIASGIPNTFLSASRIREPLENVKVERRYVCVHRVETCIAWKNPPFARVPWKK